MAIKQFRNWFFQVTGIPGTRFLKHNKPTESVMRDFLESIGFIKEVSDTASTTQQGFVKKPTNEQIISRSDADASGFTIGVTPKQLPKVKKNGVAIVPTQDSSGAQSYDVTFQLPTTVSIEGATITPTTNPDGSYNYDVQPKTDLIMIGNKTTGGYLYYPIAKGTGDSLILSSGSGVVVINNLEVKHNINNGSPCFTYNETTGVITVLKTGYYRVNISFHVGTGNTTSGYWGPGYLILAMNANNDTDNYLIDTTTVGLPCDTTCGEASYKGVYSKYVDSNVDGVLYLATGAQMRPIVLNRLANNINSDYNINANFQISVARIPS